MYADYMFYYPASTASHLGIYPIPFMPPCVRLAHAYVPYQCYTYAFPIEEALLKGTLFPDLYQPYVEKRREDKVCPNE